MTSHAEPFTKPLPRPHQRRPWFAWTLTALAVFVLVDAIFGDSGYLALRRARHEFQREQAALALVRQENVRLHEQQRRLKDDPGAIEETARRELGLLRRGEILILIRDGSASDGPSSTQDAGVQ